jgi:hypothetical protein
MNNAFGFLAREKSECIVHFESDFLGDPQRVGVAEILGVEKRKASALTSLNFFL